MDISVRTALVVFGASLGIALVGCSAAAEPVHQAHVQAQAQAEAQAQAQAEAVPQPALAQDALAQSAPADATDRCAATPGNRIIFPQRAAGAIYAELKYDLIDSGPRNFAEGEVELDGQGRPAMYTVASGDSPIAIGDRFCVDYVTVLQYNRTWPHIDPGEVLVLSPDPTVQWGDSTQPE